MMVIKEKSGNFVRQPLLLTFTKPKTQLRTSWAVGPGPNAPTSILSFILSLILLPSSPPIFETQPNTTQVTTQTLQYFISFLSNFIHSYSYSILLSHHIFNYTDLTPLLSS
ncbi:hypothetical protein QVD17_23754 [Tagetes erecta]|uniref:Uncharacterized protein n=1 Tax=Tagetes erecta TaxID=13708 RepID=A0AAD8NMF1_TARER|nr:hypothetical protein QVD17_23754 [Tagetes erecta]